MVMEDNGRSLIEAVESREWVLYEDCLPQSLDDEPAKKLNHGKDYMVLQRITTESNVNLPATVNVEGIEKNILGFRIIGDHVGLIEPTENGLLKTLLLYERAVEVARTLPYAGVQDDR